MLVRIRGHVDGIKEYLEKGQKQDREFGRDELDERVILAGDLELTNDVIQSMDIDAERYLTITLSFREDDVPERVLADIVREFEQFAFAAYEPNEYTFYAEAHLPRLKGYANRKTGELVQRKPHIHIVVPKLNLLNNQKLDPFALVMNQAKYIDAFQEHVNFKYGLESPKNNRRIELTDASEMISRYKGDVFQGANRELKASILQAVMEKDVRSYEDFKTLVGEFGARRTVNGRLGEYENVKPAGMPKGVNLREHVFTREFIEMSAEDKVAAVTGREKEGYSEPGVPKETPAALLALISEWETSRAKEIKYFNGGNLKPYPFYADASADERRALLAEREEKFYQRFNEDQLNEPNNNGQREWIERYGIDGYNPFFGGGERRFEVAREFGDGHDRDAPFWDPGSDTPGWGYEYGDYGPAPRRAPEYGMHDMSGRGMDGVGHGSEIVLPDYTHVQLEAWGEGWPDQLRRPGVGGRTGGKEQPISDAGFVAKVDAFYDAFDDSDEAFRQQMVIESAQKLRIGGFGLSGQSGGGVDPFARPAPKDLADVKALGDAPSFPASSRYHRRFAGARPRSATGRSADSVIGQVSRDLDEAKQRRAAGPQTEFQTIKASLDATRLLARLAHSHGLDLAKYPVTKGRDGSDRIQCGARNLNVSDFLTKEMHLPWAETSTILRETYRAQIGNAARPAPSRSPERALWAEFQADRAAQLAAERNAWELQRVSEKERGQRVRADFYNARGRIESDAGLSRAEKKAAISQARMAKVERDTALKLAIAGERDKLKARPRLPIGEHYREFLQRRAQGGHEAALRELRRIRQTEGKGVLGQPVIRPVMASQETNEIIYRGPVVTHAIERNGDVTYRRDGVGFMSDEGRSVRLWTDDDAAIETALRLAVQKFGTTVTLSGPAVFQLNAARVAAEQRLFMRFDDPDLNDVMEARRAEIEAEDNEKRLARHEREAHLRARAREVIEQALELDIDDDTTSTPDEPGEHQTPDRDGTDVEPDR